MCTCGMNCNWYPVCCYQLTYVNCTCTHAYTSIVGQAVNIHALPACLPACLPTCLPPCLPVSLSVCLSHIGQHSCSTYTGTAFPSCNLYSVQMSADGNWMHLLFQSRLQAKKVIMYIIYMQFLPLRYPPHSQLESFRGCCVM